jgi:hypothetical protein
MTDAPHLRDPQAPAAQQPPVADKALSIAGQHLLSVGVTRVGITVSVPWWLIAIAAACALVLG